MPKVTKPKTTRSTRTARTTRGTSLPKSVAATLFDEVDGGHKSKTSKIKTKPKAAAAKAKPAAKKSTAKKPVVKKAVAKKTVPARKTVAKPKAKAKTRQTRQPRQTKASLITYLATHADTDKKTAKLFLEGLDMAAKTALTKRGSGTFTLPGMLKIVTKAVPARKGGAMVMNRFTGEMVKQKARPASLRVKIRPLAGLKQAVA